MAAWFRALKNNVSVRYGAIIFGVVLVGQIGMQHTSLGSLAVAAYQNLATVASMSAAVLPNEYNSLAVQLDQKDKELTDREQELLRQEAVLDAKIEEATAANKRLTIIVLGSVTALLLILIFLNFYFDVKREESHERKASEEEHHEFSTKL